MTATMTAVETSYGWLRGSEENGVTVFRGVPFAQPPLGPLRFAAPQQPERWEGTRDALAFRPGPMQVGSPTAKQMGMIPDTMDEDCLYLNVWTPATDDGKRPVLVWLYGGAFVTGAGSLPLYDGARLARRGDVVIVTLNYRLGVLGYLRGRDVCGDALPSTGNEGFLDQIAALEWVRDEIARFGGDPGNVTVFGESAGAGSAAALAISPRAQGLLHKIIVESGSLGSLATPASAGDVMQRILAAAGLTPEKADRLRDLSADELMALQGTATPRTAGNFYRPVLDGDLIPTDPYAALRAGAAGDVAVLVGTNLDEMKFFRVMDPEVETLDDAGLLARVRGLLPKAGEAERVIATYQQARAARGEDTSPRELWFVISADQRMRAPAMQIVAEQHAHTPHTYAYLFTWRSPAQDGKLGSAHTMEIPFVFGNLDDPGMGPLVGQAAPEQALSEVMMDAWIAFARTGNPATPALPAWPAYEAGRRATMLFGHDCAVVDAPMEAERAIWEAVG